ncbi:hypothetical protein CLAIMM_14418, partial [Cladophialophora immunda]
HCQIHSFLRDYTNTRTEKWILWFESISLRSPSDGGSSHLAGPSPMRHYAPRKAFLMETSANPSMSLAYRLAVQKHLSITQRASLTLEGIACYFIASEPL